MYEDEELFDIIDQWTSEHPESSFDDSFVEDLQEKFDKYGTLTDGQHDALERIIDRWHMDDDYVSPRAVLKAVSTRKFTPPPRPVQTPCKQPDPFEVQCATGSAPKTYDERLEELDVKISDLVGRLEKLEAAR